MHAATVARDLSESARSLEAIQAHSAWFGAKVSDNSRRIALLLKRQPGNETSSRLEPLTSFKSPEATQSLIVVVDDEPVIAITLAEILIRHGFEAVWFTVATEALHFIKDCKIDLLLSDITMRTMDGISLAAELLRFRSDCAVFLFSGQSHEPEVRQRISILNPSIHLEAKPLRIEPLIATIRLLLAG